MRPADTPIEALPVSAVPRKRSAAQRRRDAARVQKRIEQRLGERFDVWAAGDGRSEFLVVRQDGDATPGRGADAYLHRETAGSLKGLHVEKRNALRDTRLGGDKS